MKLSFSLSSLRLGMGEGNYFIEVVQLKYADLKHETGHPLNIVTYKALIESIKLLSNGKII